MLTSQDRAALWETIQSGLWSWVALYRVDINGKSTLWSDHPQFGEPDRGEKFWALGPDDATSSEKSSVINSIEIAADDAQAEGWAKLYVRFFDPPMKGQTQKTINFGRGSKSTESIEAQTQRSLLKSHEITVSIVPAAIDGIVRSHRESSAALSRTIEAQQRQLEIQDRRIDRYEKREAELQKELKEAQKLIRELEQQASPTVIALKAMDPANMAMQATIMSGISAVFGALKAGGTWQDALKAAGAEGAEALQRLTAAIPDPQPEQQQQLQQQPEAAPA